MTIIRSPITFSALKSTYGTVYKSMTKVVVDIARGCIAVDAELHADEESLLLEDGSSQKNLWGINIFFDRPLERLVEYTSFINIRPSDGNPSMEIISAEIREKVLAITKDIIDFNA